LGLRATVSLLPQRVLKLGQRSHKDKILISYYGRTYEEGKKIGWKDGVSAIWCILKYNLFTGVNKSFLNPINEKKGLES
jgi:hypothetical protein